MRRETEGSRQLRAIPLSSSRIGRAIGFSGESVRCWRAGIDKPGFRARTALAAVFGISPNSWLEPVQVSPVDPEPDALRTEVSMAADADAASVDLPATITELKLLGAQLGRTLEAADIGRDATVRLGALRLRVLERLLEIGSHHAESQP